MRPYKLCRDCRHFDPDTVNCLMEKAKQINVVTGDVMYITAYGMRNNYDLCGLGAAYFEHFPDVMAEPLPEQPF